METWISVEEAAELSGYKENYVRELARKKRIRSQKFGWATQIDKDDLLRYKDEQESPKEEKQD